MHYLKVSLCEIRSLSAHSRLTKLQRGRVENLWEKSEACGAGAAVAMKVEGGGKTVLPGWRQEEYRGGWRAEHVSRGFL